MAARVRLGTCPVCGSGDYLDWAAGDIEMPAFCNMLSDTEEAARRQPMGLMRLAQCRECSHIWNVLFDESIAAYRAGYENSLHASPVFGSFARDLAAELIRDYALGEAVVDVGCGSGDFLRLLRAAGAARATGFDPSLPFEGVRADDQVELYARPAVAADMDGASLVVSRHVLEHLAQPGDLVELLRGSRRPGPAIYVEVPNAGYMLSENAVWDVIHEHVSYFTRQSLCTLLESHDIAIEWTREVFSGQFIAAAGRRGTPEDLAATAGRCPGSLTAFGRAFTGEIASWSGRLGVLRREGPVAVWGTGSKGVTFLNLVAGTGGVMAVDANQRKWGKYIPGSAHRILPPDALQIERPATVLVMNPLYLAEIEGQVRDMGLDAVVAGVGAPT